MNKINFDYHHDNHYKLQNKSKKTLWISLILTFIFAMLELFGGIFSNSLSLISDSFHMISDVVALIISMIAIYFASKKPNNKFTYGYLRVEILAALLNGLALIIIALGIIYESILRFINPREIDFTTMLIIAIIGLIINIVLTIILARSLKEEDNLNIKSALWHFIGDLLNSIGVITAALLVKFTGLVLFDPLISLVISIIILIGGIKISKRALLILMEATPDELSVEEIRKSILEIENVEEIHEFHLWSISESMYSLSFHVILKKYENINDYNIISDITNMIKEKYNIHHITIQIEDPNINLHN